MVRIWVVLPLSGITFFFEVQAIDAPQVLAKLKANVPAEIATFRAE